MATPNKKAPLCPCGSATFTIFEVIYGDAAVENGELVIHSMDNSEGFTHLECTECGNKVAFSKYEDYTIVNI